MLQALGCLADIVKQSTIARQKLLSAKVLASRTGAQTMLLQAVLRAALYSDDKDEQPSAVDLLAAFCQNHVEGQEALAATLLPTNSHSQPGRQIPHSAHASCLSNAAHSHQQTLKLETNGNCGAGWVHASHCLQSMGLLPRYFTPRLLLNRRMTAK